ncbi:hypothetical protein LOD99_16298 [Oopsacas minuta]|uniref:NADAR domain-containing protein n=1 Tax=Oopsacas minuta TaxID=111878 RepID=A0AAV7K7E1_9METZ|nr:hypothetical protein LOD99_16298 [Oopsacas minuta]
MAHKDIISSFSFFSNWVDWVKERTGYHRDELNFSEGLLKTLYYETDIGSIPRGAVADKYPIPKYKNNHNWNKQIIGCYWCGRDRTVVQGICCCKECIYYLHEWCVERVELFQERRFCKFPGCDKSPGDKSQVCCTRTHNYEYDNLYKFITRDQLRGLIAKGPSWYNNKQSFSTSSSVIQSTQSTHVNSAINTTIMDLAKEVKLYLIFTTDVGPIPRSYKTSDHLSSQYSNHKNWITDIKGCYYCGNIVTDKFEYFCSYKCYKIFHEWCRRKILVIHGIEFCEYPGCGKLSEQGYSTCDKFHFQRRDTFLRTDEAWKLIQKGPHWYNTPYTNTGSVSTGKVTTHTQTDKKLNTQNTIIYPSSKVKTHSKADVGLNKIPYSVNLTTKPQKIVTKQTNKSTAILPTNNVNSTLSIQNFTNTSDMKKIDTKNSTNESLIVSNFPPKDSSKLIQESNKDVTFPGFSYDTFIDSSLKHISHKDENPVTITIPSQTHNSTVLSPKLTILLIEHTDIGPIPRVIDAKSKYTDITGCYWCDAINSCFNELTCSCRCWYLLHEWCVRKVEQVCRLCVLPGCEKLRVDGCKCCSIEHIKQLSVLRGECISADEEIELIIGPKWYNDNSPISFSDRQSPFYEFSNSFCSTIQINFSTWPSVYHYLCSQRLIGTPYYTLVTIMDSVNELNTLMEKLTQWVRPDWDYVEKRLTHRAIICKFRQNSILKRLLLNTNNRQLISKDETTPGDILMDVRGKLRTDLYSQI